MNEDENASKKLGLNHLFGRARPLRRQFSVRSIIISGSALFAVLFSSSPAAQNLDSSWYQLWVSGANPSADLSPVSIVLEVGEKTNRDIGPWPWPHKSFAHLIHFLSQADASAIYIDDSLAGSFAEEEASDLEKELMEAGKKVYLKSYPESGSSKEKVWIDPPARFLVQTRGPSHLETQKASNGMTRYWAPAIRGNDGKTRFHAAFKILADEFPKAAERVDKNIHMNQMLIPWSHTDLDRIQTYEFLDWIKKIQNQSNQQSMDSDDSLFGKVIWIGSASAQFETSPWLEPISRVRSAAMLFEQMRHGKIHAPLPIWMVSTVFILCVLSMFFFARYRGIHFWVGWFAALIFVLGLSWAGISFFKIYGSPILIFIFLAATAVGILIEDLLKAESEKKVFFHLATRDGLTGLYGIRHFRMIMNNLTSEAVARNENLALVLMDIDHFKKINDSFGHLAGDEMLKKVAEILIAFVRQKRAPGEIDFLARYGGEEFMILIRRADLEIAIDVAERIRRAVESETVKWEGKSIHVTSSFGVATLQKSENIPDLMVHRADKALYRAKKSGRNRVCSEKEI